MRRGTAPLWDLDIHFCFVNCPPPLLKNKKHADSLSFLHCTLLPPTVLSVTRATRPTLCFLFEDPEKCIFVRVCERIVRTAVKRSVSAG